MTNYFVENVGAVTTPRVLSKKFNSRFDFGATARALSAHAKEVGLTLLGEPSATSRCECRWRRHGSLSLKCAGPKAGLWFDHERGEGGDLLDLIARERNVNLRGAVEIAHGILGGAGTPAYEKHQSVAADDAADRIAAADRLWRQTKLLRGTLGQQYFEQHRGLPIADLSLDHAVRWHDGLNAVVALMTDPISTKATGIHRTFLNGDGTKRERKMLGRQGVVRLSPDHAATNGLGITEGLEDGLAVLLSGWSPIWVATSAGAIARLPVLTGIESITVFADADHAGLAAAEACCARWRAAGREARSVVPRSSA